MPVYHTPKPKGLCIHSLVIYTHPRLECTFTCLLLLLLLLLLLRLLRVSLGDTAHTKRHTSYILSVCRLDIPAKRTLSLHILLLDFTSPSVHARADLSPSFLLFFLLLPP